MIRYLCIFCKHFHDNDEDKISCDAFPDGIPKDRGDEILPECNNGIKFEPEDEE